MKEPNVFKLGIEMTWLQCYRMKWDVRHLESVFRRHRFLRCHLQWWTAVVRYHQLLGSKQRSFWRLLESAGNSRALWKTLSGLMSPSVTQTTCITPAGFVAHFKNKVDAIRASTAGAPLPMTGRTCSSSLSSIVIQPRHYSRHRTTA